MESDQQPAEASDDPKPPSTTTTTTPPRSYECHFCKRGFTNAQALGGHMNIHRKDKAKFKHSSSSSTTLTTPNSVVNSPSPTRPRLSPTTTAAISTSANPFSISHQGNWFSPPPQDEKQSLPLFGHDTNVPRNIPQEENPRSPGDREVDLELRLGHVDQQEPESSSENKTTTTRKFF